MTSLTQEQRKWLDKCTDGTWTLNPKTGLVDVDGDFWCSNQGLTDFKGVKFGEVKRGFNCENNRLTSLEGAPQEVGGSFNCAHNSLTSLEGAPLNVGGYFWCCHNSLTSLVGAPKTVGGSFDCNKNRLTSLVGAPQEVSGSFACNKNRLTSLVGAPQEVGGSFNCEKNSLTSLVGAPLKVGMDFYCDNNPVSQKTLKAIFEKMQKCHSFVIAAASLRNEMSKKDWKLIDPYIPEAIRPGVSMLARFGVFG